MVHKFENLEIIVYCDFLTSFDVSWTLVIVCFLLYILYIYIIHIYIMYVYIVTGFLYYSPGCLESQFIDKVGL